MTERMRITSGGNVEIGTVSTSGGRTLTIRASSGNSASVRLQNTVHDWDVNCQTNNRFAIFSQTDGVERFVIVPTSGNVLIGTTTDSNQKMQVYSSGTTRIKIDGAGNNSGVLLAESGTNQWSLASASSSLLFYNEVNTVTRMTITSTGAVTKPNQPAWSVGLSGTQSYLTNVPSVIFWNQSSGNDCFIQGGVTLNGDLGRITVPVAGKYMLFASIRTEATGAANGTNLNLRRNGTTILRHYVGSSVNSQGSFMYIETRPVIINCEANDYIDSQFDSITGDFNISATSNTVVRFGGFLMG
jgi:hypothetical protein